MSDNMIDDTVRHLFANEVQRDLLELAEQGVFARDLWRKVSDAGMTKILCLEAHSGIEASWEDAMPLFFQTGYTQAPIPLAQAVVGQYFASRHGIDLAADGVFSLATGCQSRSLVAECDAQGVPLVVSGTIKAMKWARHADWLLVELKGGIALLSAKAKGVEIQHGGDAASLPSDGVVLSRVAVQHWWPLGIAGLRAPAHTAYATAVAAQLTGALEYALDLAVQYAKDRIQFGKPIGKNQAIQHQLALLAGEVACSYAATCTALRDLPALHADAAFEAEFSAAVAKVTASDAVKLGASVAHQVHGAIGFTYEYPLNFATRRLWAWRAEAGSSTEWAQCLGKAFIAAGAERFWPQMTSRQLPAENATAPAHP